MIEENNERIRKKQTLKKDERESSYSSITKDNEYILTLRIQEKIDLIKN